MIRRRRKIGYGNKGLWSRIVYTVKYLLGMFFYQVIVLSSVCPLLVDSVLVSVILVFSCTRWDRRQLL